MSFRCANGFSISTAKADPEWDVFTFSTALNVEMVPHGDGLYECVLVVSRFRWLAVGYPNRFNETLSRLTLCVNHRSSTPK